MSNFLPWGDMEMSIGADQ